MLKKRLKLNQKGMTLIEVMAAMAILAIVLAPTLRIFSSTAGTNFRAKQRQRATSVGESVMEGFKAYTLRKLCVDFNSGNFMKDILKASASDSVVTTMSVDSDALKLNNELNTDKDSFTFTINNAKSEGRFYDVTAVVRPRQYIEEALKTEDIDLYSDAIIALDENMGADAYAAIQNLAKAKLAEDHPTYSYVKSDVRNFRRHVNINIDDKTSASSSGQIVTVKVTYTAKVRVYYNSYSLGEDADATWSSDSDIIEYNETDGMKYEVKLPTEAGEVEWVAYDNTATIAGTKVDNRICKLNNIYFYYFPTYNTDDVYGSGAGDEIVITGKITSLYDPNNITATDPEAEGYTALRFIAIKQKSSTLDNGRLKNAEVSYGSSSAFWVDPVLFSKGGKIVFYSNLTEDLSKTESSVISVPDIDYFDEVKELKYSTIGRVNTLYDVEISVSEAGSSEVVAQFIGTMND
ncbi:MAG: type II secretion system protein [Lachnospiraceae bacterium]|nr:type II secretion system protein [Lachnospiraceae bacterium]